MIARSMTASSPDDIYASYLSGDVVGAWAKLVSLGDKVRAPHILPHAQAVADEMMQRVRTNIATIAGRLKVSGYRFARSKYVLVDPDADVERQLDRLEKVAGALPLALRAAYTQIGECNLAGTHPSWSSTAEITLQRPSAGKGVWRTDALALMPLYIVLEEAETEWDRVSPFDLMVSGDATTKSGDAVGEYTIHLPSQGADAALRGAGHGSFVDHLRDCCRFGGFAGFAEIGDRPNQMITELTAGLIPF